MDVSGNIVLRVNRPFSFINSRISISKGDHSPDGSNKIGKCQQIWHPYRRKYALFQRYIAGNPLAAPPPDDSSKSLTNFQENSSESYSQFANIDARLLAWDFYLQNEHGKVLASVNRNFMGFGRELFLNTGQFFKTPAALQSAKEYVRQASMYFASIRVWRTRRYRRDWRRVSA